MNKLFIFSLLVSSLTLLNAQAPMTSPSSAYPSSSLDKQVERGTGMEGANEQIRSNFRSSFDKSTSQQNPYFDTSQNKMGESPNSTKTK